jgi:hypothetical protein
MLLNRLFENATLSQAFPNVVEQRLRKGEELLIARFGR